MDPVPRPRKRFTVAIVGAGVSGLTLAIGLLRYNVPVQIYEAAAAFKEIGLGLSIGPEAHRAMPLIDPRVGEIYDQLVTTHTDSPGYEHLRQTWFEIVWATGEKAGQTLMDLKAAPSGQTSVRRADFLDALVRLIPSEITHFGKRLEAVSEDETGVTLSFKDGSSAMADIVLGCDGIRSRVKEMVLPKEYKQIIPRYSGMYGYRAALDMETVIAAVGDRHAKVATMYVGQGAYAISYPIMRARKVNVGLYKMSDNWSGATWVQPTERVEMLKDFAHMGQHVNALMEHTQDSSQWAIFEQPPIPTYTRSRIAVLGDAAHASTPHQGAGAGQAIEDAHVLAELLSDPHVIETKHLVAAFQAYDTVRRPRSQEVVVSSKENGYLLCLCLDGVNDDEEKLKYTFSKRFRWLWDIDIVGQAERARRILMELMRAQEKL